MSSKNRFKSVLLRRSVEMKGSHLTKQSRALTLGKFVDIMWANNITHLVTVSHIQGKHLRLYASVRKNEGAAIRTQQNEIAHLRTILRSFGCHAVADSVELNNKSLSIGGGSRIGTKQAATDDEIARILAIARKQKRGGIECCLLLERFLGLRGNEAIHATADTLNRWLKELENNQEIRVFEGTKGGRSRCVKIWEVDLVGDAIAKAVAVAKAQGGFLIVGKNEEKEVGLKEARSIYHGWCYRAKIQPHSLRYRFAREQLQNYQKNGFKLREAEKAVCRDLGHGGGRVRWLRSVYMK